MINDRFLVYINDILTSGWIPGLFAKDEVENIFAAMRGQAKQAGVVDTPDAMKGFLIQRLKAKFTSRLPSVL